MFFTVVLRVYNPKLISGIYEIYENHIHNEHKRRIWVQELEQNLRYMKYMRTTFIMSTKDEYEYKRWNKFFNRL